MNRFARIAAKFIYGLFIVWLGVLAPLIFFDVRATHHHIQPYRLALFAAPAWPRALTTKDVASPLIRPLKPRFNLQQDFIAPTNAFSGLAHLLQSSLGQLYLIAAAAGLLRLLFGPLNGTAQPAGASADLPLPKKPPRLAWPQI
ncbi:MAG: hypothetical protein KDI79_23515 [Anaerolineae bacterium]|nr:hypothetical protein [Anaerolineae bacterium]